LTFAWDAGVPPLLRFAAPAGFSVAFTSRLGGVSSGVYDSLNLGMGTRDDAALVGENRRRAVEAAGGSPEWATGCHQTHSAAVAEVELDDLEPGAFLRYGTNPPRVDALATQDPGVTLMTLGGDCLTVALCLPGDTPRLGVAHAGWPGLLNGVLENVASAVGPGAICAIGPSAGPCCYEVRDDVGVPLRERFGDDVVRGGRADLWLCAERALRSAGAAEVHVSGICTICDPDRFYSHRRDGSPGGRQAVLARLDAAA
jgi:copper oxidase (laccase) domain-containing protein